MPVSIRLLFTALPLAVLAGGQVQPRGFKSMPPEIVVSREHAPTAPFLIVELDNAQMRVIRSRIGSFAAMRADTQLRTGQQGGLLVAITPLDLRMTATDGKTQDAHLAAGRSQWFAASAFAFLNLSAEDCEFLLIEAKR
jgi:hypothetical protein